MPLNVDLLTVREISLELLGQDRGSGESPNQLQSSLGELLKAALVGRDLRRNIPEPAIDHGAAVDAW